MGGVKRSGKVGVGGVGVGEVEVRGRVRVGGEVGSGGLWWG